MRTTNYVDDSGALIVMTGDLTATIESLQRKAESLASKGGTS